MASNSFLKSLQRGQILKATVEDTASPSEVLCSFHGELLLIANHSAKRFKKGSLITLQVSSLNPLQFQIYSPDDLQFRRVV